VQQRHFSFDKFLLFQIYPLAAKWARIEPEIVFKNLFVQMVYNQQHQLAVANQVVDTIETFGCQLSNQVLQRLRE
jgi:hypothetical protein